MFYNTKNRVQSST